jgi:uncharacterized protein (TIGR02284 family)
MRQLQEEAVSVLNGLIESCNDDEMGYKTAAEHAGDPALKALFSQYSQQRAQFASELRMEVRRRGGDPAPSGSMSGAFHRGWMHLKSVISRVDDETIARECARAESSTLHAYEEALERELPFDAREVLQRQRSQIQEARDHLSALEEEEEGPV